MSKLRGNKLEPNCEKEFPHGCGAVATKELTNIKVTAGLGEGLLNHRQPDNRLAN